MKNELKALQNEENKIIIKCYREVKNTEVVLSFLTSFVMASEIFSPSGEVISDYVLTATNKNLYIEEIYHAPYGGVADVANSYKIPFESIEEFKVEKKDELEYITIVAEKKPAFLSRKKRMLSLIYKDPLNENKAMKMKELIGKI